MSKKVVPLPLNSKEREQLLEAINATVIEWKRVASIGDFLLIKDCTICKWSNKFIKTLTKDYGVKLNYKDDVCRFCPVYVLNRNRSICSSIEHIRDKIGKKEVTPTEFESFRNEMEKDAERLLLLHKSQTGTSRYRRHILEMLKLSQKVAKRKAKRRKPNASKTQNPRPRNKQN